MSWCQEQKPPRARGGCGQRPAPCLRDGSDLGLGRGTQYTETTMKTANLSFKDKENPV